METISYSIVCEDAAHYFFVKRLLSFHFDGLHFNLNEDCFTRYKCNTKTQVLNGYVNIANQIFRNAEFRVKLLFVVTDHDDDERLSADYHKDMHDAVFAEIKDKVIISIPMKCIEHWLRYLQWKKENPTATKNESMEGERRSDSKMKVYGSKKPSRDKQDKVVNDLLQERDISWLTTRSSSFNHLYTQITSLRS